MSRGKSFSLSILSLLIPLTERHAILVFLDWFSVNNDIVIGRSQICFDELIDCTFQGWRERYVFFQNVSESVARFFLVKRSKKKSKPNLVTSVSRLRQQAIYRNIHVTTHPFKFQLK